jgi:hypothetical protein
MAKMRSENPEYEKSMRDYLDTFSTSNSYPDARMKTEDFRQAIAKRAKANRDLEGKKEQYIEASKETGYDYGPSAQYSTDDSVDRLSRSPTSDSEGMMKYRKGGMVKKKATKMAGGGAVRGAGCATKGKGKMRMY